ncbi:hypothetical protein [Thalassospira sp.]|uniref:hypothetical protein n=1 Tax=Thalassospira sp. TaxID=1912094 RepID=UPI002736DA46|nr:hypothetical protein [Thalassospira sp.]MDP2697236.1 hypothetical protein [Thalassospira sp.]
MTDQQPAGTAEKDFDGPDIRDPDADLDALAQRFLDLWRAQVAATVDGNDAANAIGRLYAGLGADTSRIGEGFEAWGRLIGQLATGQKPDGDMMAGFAPMPGFPPGSSGFSPFNVPPTATADSSSAADNRGNAANEPAGSQKDHQTGGATAPADASGGRDDELAELARRIATLSETISALEAGTGRTGAKPADGDEKS